MTDLNIIEHIETLREHNDRFRSRCAKPIYDALIAGKFLIAKTISKLSSDDQYNLHQGILNYNDFDDENDPWDEHSYGTIKLSGGIVGQWKIDYFKDEACSQPSENPAIPRFTYRVMTISLVRPSAASWTSIV